MLDKKIDKLIDNITPALLNAGEKAPTDYNELYKIISNAVQVVKATLCIHVQYNMRYSISDYIDDFCMYCYHFNIPMHIMHNNIFLVRSIVQEIIK